MAAREWLDAVKREVRDMLVPGLARRRASRSADNARGSDAVRRQIDITALPPAVLPTAITADPLAGADGPTTLALAPSSTSTSSTSQIVLQSPTLSAPAATSQPSDSDSGDMGVAAKAGIVIGALGGILLLGVLVYLVVSMRKKKLARRRQQMEDDEKIHGPFSDSAAIPAARQAPNKAPRLSLRPVTQFLPNFTERRSSRGNALALNPVSQGHLRRPTNGSAWERPALRLDVNSPDGGHNRPDTSASLHPNNPFHDKNRMPDEPVNPVSSMGSFEHRVGMATTTDSIPEPVSPIIGDDDDDRRRNHNHNHNQLGVASSSLTRKTSIRKDLPKPLDLTKPPSPLYAVPPSPAGTEYSMQSVGPGQSPGPSASAEAIAAAGGPSQSTVHRVQLDFKPTLQDEMELRAGQLVRLLHEYDDGWALCIRLDRSQQGVVPRTCLSTRPVKPRPQQQGGGSSSPGGYSNHHHHHTQQQGNQRGGPPVNPSFHFGLGSSGGNSPSNGNSRSNSRNQGGRPTSPGGYGVPPAPVAKDERYGGHGGYGGGNGGYGRPRSPLARGPSPSSSSAQQGWGRGDEEDGGVSPAVGQAY